MQDPEQEEKHAEWERKRQEKKKTSLEQCNMENIDGLGLGEGCQRLLWIWESTSEDADGTGMLDGKIVFIDPLNLPFHFQGFEYNGQNPEHGHSDGQRKSFF